VNKYGFAVILILMCILLCGCSGVSEIEKSVLVTACEVNFNNDTLTYRFYVSVPKGKSESESGSKTSGGKIYEFEGNNFSDAIKNFKQTVSGKIDLGHLCLFVAEPEYIDFKFQQDYPYIIREIKTTPIMYYCMASSGENKIMEYISSECEGNPMKFAENMFKSDNRHLACTATELHFSCENKYYTAVIPVIGIYSNNSASVAVHDGAYMYSQVSGTFFVSGQDYEIYKLCRKKIYDSERFYTININADKMWIVVDPQTHKSKEICDFANRYSTIGFDILNCIYYSKKKFLTYNSYMSYADKMYAQNLNFTQGR